MQAWLSFWMDGKIRRSKTFSSKVHGFEPARKMAIDFLKEKRKENGLSSPDCEEGDLPSDDADPPSRPGRRTAPSPGGLSSLSSVSTGLIELGKST